MVTVGIVMGNDSDMPIMAEAAEVLEKFGIAYETRIISAYFEPDILYEYAKSASERGIKVMIAGASKAVHLPGMCAAIFAMPVIGIPIESSGLNGRDSLNPTIQMPCSIPIATVTINSGKNAGLLAAQILATSDITLREKIKIDREKYMDLLEKKDEHLQQQGYKNYPCQN